MKKRMRAFASIVVSVSLLVLGVWALNNEPATQAASQRSESVDSIAKPVVIDPEEVRSVLNEPAKEYYN